MTRRNVVKAAGVAPFAAMTPASMAAAVTWPPEGVTPRICLGAGPALEHLKNLHFLSEEDRDRIEEKVEG